LSATRYKEKKGGEKRKADEAGKQSEAIERAHKMNFHCLPIDPWPPALPHQFDLFSPRNSWQKKRQKGEIVYIYTLNIFKYQIAIYVFRSSAYEYPAI